MNNIENNTSTSDIAVIGMACRLPGARNPVEFWKNLRDGVESVVRYTEDELLAAGVHPGLLADPSYVPVGAPLADMEMFDASFFGFSPREASVMDPQHRHFLECAWEALENAGHEPDLFDGPIGVWGGSGHNAYMPYNLLSNSQLMRQMGFFLVRHTGNDKDFLTTRVSYLLDLRGPSVNVQTACSTSLVAIHMAAQSLLTNECDMALAGGVTIELPHRQGYQYQEGEILSPDGHCHSFDAGSQGTLFGSGVGIVVLRRLQDALEDGDHIHAVIKGSAINNDGSMKVGYLAPSVDGQAECISEALAVGEIDARSVTYVETHGTGTPVGDPIEIAALTQAFRQFTDDVGYCHVGSVKTNIGHLDTAAGVASFIKVVKALEHKQLPPSLNFSKPNPACDFGNSPFQVNAKLSNWEAFGTPLRAGVSSMGVGGTNAHIVLEEPAQSPDIISSRNHQLILISAKSEAALEPATDNLATHLQQHPEINLADTAYTLQVGRRSFVHRRSLAVSNIADAIKVLQDRNETRITTSFSPYVEPRPVAFMFAGGGAQYPGMCADLYRSEPVFEAAMNDCLKIVNDLVDFDLKALLYPTPEAKESAASELQRPSRTIPAIFVTQYAQAQLWLSWGIEPESMIGHSMGEYTAAHLAGVFDLDDVLQLVVLRGKLFEKVPGGGMLSVGMESSALRPLMSSDLSIAAENGPKLCVASGPVASIEALQKTLEQQDVDHVRVRIEVAAHSAMLEPILSEFGQFFSKVQLNAPKLPFVSNVTGTWITSSEAQSSEYWVSQLRSTVQFSKGISELVKKDGPILLEVGPGRTLTTLSRQHPDHKPEQLLLSSSRHPDEKTHDVAFTLGVLGQLWGAGAHVNWEGFYGDERRKRTPLPTYPFEKQRHWVEPLSGTQVIDAEEDEAGKRSNLGDWFYQQYWARAPLHKSDDGNPSRRILIIEDLAGLGQELADLLRRAGHQIITAKPADKFEKFDQDRFCFDPDNVADVRSLLEASTETNGAPQQIIHMLNVTEGDRPDSPVQAYEQQRHSSFSSLLYLAQAIGHLELYDPLELCIISNGLHSIDESDTLHPEKALLQGPTRVIPSEYQNVTVRSIDIPLFDSPQKLDDVVEKLKGEVLGSSDDSIIAYREKGRLAQGFAPVRVPKGSPSASRLKDGGVYLITGGLGGIGLTLAEHLARRGNVKLVLVSRSGLPLPAQWNRWCELHPLPDGTTRRIQRIRKLEQLGAEVLVCSTDITDVKQTNMMMSQISQKFGTLNGIFHTAGVIDDGIIQLKDMDDAERVLEPKIRGTLVLDGEIKNLDLDFFILFSSISAISGLPGQVDYAAANAFLDAYAQSRNRSTDTWTVAIDWNAWQEVGMAASLARQLGLVSESELGEDDYTTTSHPLLTRQLKSESSSKTFLGRFDLECWLLSEHRIKGGHAVLPGTGYLELARTAFEMFKGKGNVEISDVAFLLPFTINAGQHKELRIQLKEEGSSTGWVVTGPPETGFGAWNEHASGRIAPMDTAQPERHDIPSILERCNARTEKVSNTNRDQHVDFGPRWDNLRCIHYGQREALAELELPNEFAGDLGQYPMHPSLLDMATAGAQPLIPDFDASNDFFVPMSYQRLRVYHALPTRILSHIRLRPGGNDDVAIFDVTLLDERGVELVDIHGFAMKRITDKRIISGLSSRPQATANPILEHSLKFGISPSEGMEILERVLSSGFGPRLLISSQSLDKFLAAAGSGTGSAVAGSDGAQAGDGGSTLNFVAPRTEREQQITNLFEELLGISQVGVHDNFFDIGGHSLLAVRLFAKLHKMTGMNLPLATLFEAPTPETLAKHFGGSDPVIISEEVQEALADEALEAAANSSHDSIVKVEAEPKTTSESKLWHSLVTLQPKGDLPPFFSIHGRGGNVLNYMAFVSHLGADQPLYGLQCRGLDGKEDPFPDLYVMAQQYIEDIRTVQPHGPYYLGGGSMGGTVALEMAQQLIAQGEDVGLVAMFDSYGPNYFEFMNGESTDVDNGMGKAMRHLRDLQQLEPREQFSYVQERVATRITTQTRAMSVRAHKAINRPLPHELRYWDLEQHNVEILMKYQPLEYHGHIAFFRAMQQPEDVYPDPAMGWSNLAMGGLDVIPIPGTHNSLIEQPVLGQQLRIALQKAQLGR